MIICPQCKTQNKAGARFCIKCGAAFGRQDSDKSMRRNSMGEDSATTPLPTPWASENDKLSASSAPPPPGAKTQRLAPPPQHFSPLSKDELLDDDRYVVTACIEQGAAGNRYLVRDRRRRRCPQCDHEQDSTDAYCAECGSHLPSDSYYLLLEAYEKAALAKPFALIERHFTHPHLVNGRRVFHGQAAGQAARAYLVKDPVLVGAVQKGVRQATRVIDAPAITSAQAVDWLADLADLLDSAINQGIYFPAIAAAQLLLGGNVLLLDAIESAEIIGAQQRQDAVTAHCRQLPRLFQELTSAQPVTPQMKAALAAVESGPSTAAVAAVESLKGALQAGSAAAAKPLTLAVGCLSDLGLVREINEDSLVTLELNQVYNSANAPLRLYAVADGMGGHAAGEVASRLALTQLVSSLISRLQSTGANNSLMPTTSPLILLKQASQDAARAVYEEARRSRSDMGTTLVAALVEPSSRKVYAINVGDSRLYQINAASIRRITKDHSLVQRLIDSNQLTLEEARHHPNANLIYRTLGEKANIEIDTFEVTLAAGDTLLLCSDGLCGLVDDADIHAAASTQPAPQAACARLIELAKVAGGHDNITAIVVSIGTDSEQVQE